ncbi:MAG: glycosyltransferase [Patescibacteria group bacterium]
MRITLCTHNLNREGAPLVLLRLANGLNSMSHDCHILSPKDGPLRQRCVQADIPFQIIPELYDHNRQYHPIQKNADIVIVNTILGYHIVEQCKHANIPVIWIIHESERSIYETLFPDCTGSAFRSASAVVFPADATRRIYADCLAGNAYMIHNSVDLEEIDTHIRNIDPLALRQELGILPEAPIVSLIGTICPRKGQYEFIEASIRIAHELSGQPIAFLMLGNILEDEHKAYLQRALDLAKFNSAQQYVCVIPETENAFDIIALSEICVCPSFIEACPLVILEAMALGRPIIASDTYGIPEIIEDGVNGLLIPPGHAGLLADRIRILLSDPEHAHALGQNARSRIEERFTHSKTLQNYAELIDTIAAPYRTMQTKENLKKMTGEYTNEVAVIIPCHNYAHFLAEAIESVLMQTIRPAEIIVVDDASVDNTKEVALKYEDQGIKYIRGEWHSVGAARNVGLERTNAPFIICLDADDKLHPEYVCSGLSVLKNNPSAAIAYTSHQCFGSEDSYYNAPDQFDWRRFEMENHMHSASMVRREAIEQIGGWSHGVTHHGDWVTWRRILRLGWKAVKSDGIFYYRKHDSNMFPSLSKKKPYAQRTGFLEEPATLFLALSGLEQSWPLTSEFLEQQTFPHEHIHLVIMDTSENYSFSNIIRIWLAQCDYGAQTYLKESQEINPEAIYNRFARFCINPLALLLKEDVIPPLDAFERLTLHFDHKTISVSGIYLPQLEVWQWTEDGKPIGVSSSTDVESVGGNGFGCLVLRGEFLRQTVFQSTSPHNRCEYNFYHTYVYKEGFKALVDFNCRCSPNNYDIAPSTLRTSKKSFSKITVPGRFS